MTTRAIIVAGALGQNGLGDGEGYPGRSNPADPVLGRPNEFWCFAAGTLVSTPDGLRPIEELRVGDEIVAADGTRQQVLVAQSRPAAILNLRAFGLDGTRVTAEHPYWTRRAAGRGRFEDPRWVGAGNLRRGDLIAFPLRDDGNEPMNPDVAYVIGRYVADGWTTVYGSSRRNPTRPLSHYWLCCAHDETDEVEKAIRLAGLEGARGASGLRYPTVTQFGLPVAFGEKYLRYFGSSARGKRVDGMVLCWDRAAREAFLAGYLDGDGSERDGLVRATSVSRALALGVAEVVRSLGYRPAVYAYPREKQARIGGRLVAQASVGYEIHFRRDPILDQCRRDERFLWAPVRSVADKGDAEVYTLTVSGPNTFIADGAAVHNCADWVTYRYLIAGLPLPLMQQGMAGRQTGFAYCPSGEAYAKAHGAWIPSWEAQPADLLLFDWNGDGDADHVEVVTSRAGAALYSIGGDSGPSNVDGFRGQGGVHRHEWSDTLNVGNGLILGAIDCGKLVAFVAPQPPHIQPPQPTVPGWYHRVLSFPIPSSGVVGTIRNVRTSTGVHPMQYGPDVVVVQHKVGAIGDGYFGPGTHADVVAWQKRHGLVGDGDVGPLTAEKMGPA